MRFGISFLIGRTCSRSVITGAVSAVIFGAAVALGACGGGDSSGPHTTQVVQVVNSTVDDATLDCTDPLEDTEAHYQVDFRLELVNTTDAEVSVTGVSSRGDVVSSTRPNDFPANVHTFASLPYEPTPILLRAHDGDVTMHVTMRVPCGTAVVTQEYARTIRTTIFVLTTAGLYTSIPIDVRVTWHHAVTEI